jgi:hypothetical protein
LIDQIGLRSREPEETTMTRIFKGSCFCGSVEIEVSDTPEGMGYCHCASCRAWPAEPVNAVTLWRQMSVRVIKAAE